MQGSASQRNEPGRSANYEEGASRQASQMCGPSRPRAGTARSTERAHARTSAVARHRARPRLPAGSVGCGAEFGGGPGVGGGEVAVGPFLGELAGLGEHDRHGGPADLQFGEAVGDHRGPDPVELEDLRIPVLDDDRGAGQRGEFTEGEAQFAGDQAGDQVGERLAFHRGDQLPADGQCRSHRRAAPVWSC